MKYKLITIYVNMLDAMIRTFMSMREYARPTTLPAKVEEGTFDSLFGNMAKIADEAEFDTKIIQK